MVMICYLDHSMNQSLKEYPSLRQLYPSLSTEELRIAQENIDRYVHLIWRICKRLEYDDQLRRKDDLKV